MAKRVKFVRVHPDFHKKLNRSRRRMEAELDRELSFQTMTKFMADKWDSLEKDVFNVVNKKKGKGKGWILFK